MEPKRTTPRWWPCLWRKCVFSVGRLEKNGNFWDAYKCWTWWLNCGQDVNDRTWILFSFFFHCVGEYSCIVKWNESLFSVRHLLGWSFRVLHFYGSVCSWSPKMIWQRKFWFWTFFAEICHVSLSHYLYGIKCSTIVDVYFFEDEKIFR